MTIFPLNTQLHPFKILNRTFTNSSIRPSLFTLFTSLQFRRLNSLCEQWWEVNGTIQSISVRCMSQIMGRPPRRAEIWKIDLNSKQITSTQDTKSKRNNNLVELDFKRTKTTSLQTWRSFLYFRDVADWFSVLYEESH